MIIKLIFAVAAIATALAGEDFCALRVEVVSSFGSKLEDAKVMLLDPSGKVVRTEVTDRGGYAEFCDFEEGAHSVVVQSDCMPVTISNIWFQNHYTNSLKIVRQSCLHFMGTLVCSAVVRIRSRYGPLRNALVTAMGIKEPLVGDKYGRFIFGMRPGTETSIRIEAIDYLPTTITMKACESGDVVQQTVVLKAKWEAGSKP